MLKDAEEWCREYRPSRPPPPCSRTRRRRLSASCAWRWKALRLLQPGRACRSGLFERSYSPAGSQESRDTAPAEDRSEEHTSELQSHSDLVCRLLLEKKKKTTEMIYTH